VSENDNFAQEFYWKMREAVTGRLSRDAKRIIEKKKRGGSRPFDKGRDPLTAGASLDFLIKDFKWSTELGEADLFNSWAKIVGEDTAAKSNPETLEKGVLTVRCASTAWATQLRLMQSTILERLKADFADLEIIEIKLLGPASPSFKRGPRSVPGRGPRDTYG
jgi:predicted nucleic acid-binding Zn ribbon protein